MEYPHVYFAFGMNLDPEAMDLDDDAEQTEYGTTGCEPIIGGTLDGWKLGFRHYADVQEVEGHTVRGGLWRINDEALRVLDRREGYPRLYDRKEVEVLGDDGITYTAIVYFMPKDGIASIEAAPSPGYVSMLERGYAFFNLDPEPLHLALRAVYYKDAANACL